MGKKHGAREICYNFLLVNQLNNYTEVFKPKSILQETFRKYLRLKVAVRRSNIFLVFITVKAKALPKIVVWSPHSIFS